MTQIHPNKSNSEFFKGIEARVNARRNKDRSSGIEGQRRFDPEYSKNAMICYAYSISTGEYYVGYSGSAGGMFGNKKGGALYTANPDAAPETLDYRAHRRFLRVGKELSCSFGLDRDTLTSELIAGTSQFGNKNETRKFPACNCAEASALAIAASYESEHLPHLVFTTFHSKHGVYPPCANCKTWIHKSFAYHDGSEYKFRSK